MEQLSYWRTDASGPLLETAVRGVPHAAATTDPDRLTVASGLSDVSARKCWTYSERSRACVFIEKIQMTPSGKIQKFRLAEDFANCQLDAAR